MKNTRFLAYNVLWALPIGASLQALWWHVSKEAAGCSGRLSIVAATTVYRWKVVRSLPKASLSPFFFSFFIYSSCVSFTRWDAIAKPNLNEVRRAYSVRHSNAVRITETYLRHSFYGWSNSVVRPYLISVASVPFEGIPLLWTGERKAIAGGEAWWLAGALFTTCAVGVPCKPHFSFIFCFRCAEGEKWYRNSEHCLYTYAQRKLSIIFSRSAIQPCLCKVGFATLHKGIAARTFYQGQCKHSYQRMKAPCIRIGSAVHRVPLKSASLPHTQMHC